MQPPYLSDEISEDRLLDELQHIGQMIADNQIDYASAISALEQMLQAAQHFLQKDLTAGPSSDYTAEERQMYDLVCWQVCQEAHSIIFDFQP